jgi:hypothetical protein
VAAHRPAASEVSAILAALYLLSCPLILRFTYKNHFRRTRTTNEDSVIEFEETMIRCQGAHSSGEIEWAAIRSFSEDDKILILYLSPAKFLCVPKRACGKEEIEQLRAFLREKSIPPEHLRTP